MKIITNHSGTTSPTFSIGKGGITVSQGVTLPSTPKGLHLNTANRSLHIGGEGGWSQAVSADFPLLLHTADSRATSAKVLSATAPLQYTGGVVSMVNNPAFNGSGGMVPPKGTTAQRPVTPRAGEMRYNTETGLFEVHGAAWSSLARVRTFTFLRSDIAVDTIVFTHNLGNVPVIATVYDKDGKIVSTSATWGNNTVSMYFGLSVLLVLSGTLTCVVVG